MDAELLEQLQASGSRIKAGGKTGLVHAFRTGNEGWIELRDPDTGDVTPVATQAFEVVDPVDPAKVAAFRERQAQEALGFQIARSMANQVPVIP